MITSRVTNTFIPTPDYILRGWATDFTYYDTDDDQGQLEALAHFPFTIPDEYLDGDSITITIRARVEAVGPDLPDSYTALVYATADSVDGGPSHIGPYSASDESYAPDALLTSWLGDNADSIDDVWTDYDIPITYVSRLGGVLPDLGGGDSQRGWYQKLYNSGTPPDDPWTPGREITAEVGLYFNSDDDVNPDRAAYVAIQSVSWAMSGQTGTVDLTSMRVGFNTGKATVSWTVFGAPLPPGAAPFNDDHSITVGARPEAFAYQDAFLQVA